MRALRQSAIVSAMAIFTSYSPVEAQAPGNIPGWMRGEMRQTVAQFRAATHISAPLIAKTDQLPTIYFPVTIGSHRLFASFAFYEGKLHDIDVRHTTADHVPCLVISQYLDEILGPGRLGGQYISFVDGSSDDPASPSYVPRDTYEWDIPGSHASVALTIFRGQEDCTGFSMG